MKKHDTNGCEFQKHLKTLTSHLWQEESLDSHNILYEMPLLVEQLSGFFFFFLEALSWDFDVSDQYYILLVIPCKICVLEDFNLIYMVAMVA